MTGRNSAGKKWYSPYSEIFDFERMLEILILQRGLILKEFFKY